MENNNYAAESCLYVSEDVVASVITKACLEVDGVYSIAKSASNPLRLLLAKHNYGKIKFRLDGDVLQVAVGIVLIPEAAAAETAEKVQERVKSEVQSILGLTVARVNVNVVDIAV